MAGYVFGEGCVPEPDTVVCPCSGLYDTAVTAWTAADGPSPALVDNGLLRTCQAGNADNMDLFFLSVNVNEGVRGGPRNLDSGLSEISIVFQAAVPKPVVPKYTTSGVRRPSEL